MALAIGGGIPLVGVFLSCRRPTSEGCVWGKSLLPISLPVGFVIYGGLAFLALTAINLLVGRLREKR